MFQASSCPASPWPGDPSRRWAIPRRWTSRYHEGSASGSIRAEEGIVVSAYILIQAEVGKATQVTKEMKDIKGIKIDGPSISIEFK